MLNRRGFFPIVIIFLALLACQASGASRARYGLRIGINFATLRGDAEEIYVKADVKQGLCIGGHAEIPLNSFLFVQPEMLYDNKGAKSSENPSEKVNLSYLNIPVLLKVKIPGDIPVRPLVLVGVAPNLLLSAKAKWGGPDIDVMDLTTKFDGSLIFGTGCDIKGGTGHFVIEARYAVGFLTLDIKENYDIRNRVFSIIGGYTFR